jgi:hypothetical protein
MVMLILIDCCFSGLNDGETNSDRLLFLNDGETNSDRLLFLNDGETNSDRLLFQWASTIKVQLVYKWSKIMSEIYNKKNK